MFESYVVWNFILGFGEQVDLFPGGCLVQFDNFPLPLFMFDRDLVFCYSTWDHLTWRLEVIGS